MNDKLIIIDTFYFLHRAFHSFSKDLLNSEGLHTNICYGFSRALLDSISEFNPSHIVCGWESEDLPSFRKTLFADYQKTRVPMEPEDEKIFSEQIPWIVKIIEAFNIPRVTSNGFEGDDVIGTVATLASKDISVIIISSDQDMLQLINDKINVFRPARPPFISKQLFGISEVKEKYGFLPPQMIDYKALRGDPSDCIPGVLGVGDKTAKSLIAKYGSLENIYQNLEEISASVRKKLEMDKDQAYLSRQLATIITNIPLEFNLSSAVVHDFEESKVRDIFEELGFKSLIPRLEKFIRMKNVKEHLSASNKKNEAHQIGLFG